MEIPNHCKCCKQSVDDCVLLFRASKIRKIRNKRFLLKKCPCNDCLMIPICNETCSALKEYINTKVHDKTFIMRYFDAKPIDWLKRKGI
jgi:hypothetical protein